MNKPAVEEIGKIAEEAYIYAFPMLMGYRLAFASFLMPGQPSHRGPVNTLHGKAVRLDHTFKDVITPNADTPCSMTCRPSLPDNARYPAAGQSLLVGHHVRTLL